jgi:hypothetical protein
MTIGDVKKEPSHDSVSQKTEKTLAEKSSRSRVHLMPLTMRPTGLGSGINKDRPDYTVYTGEWEVGRIYEARGGSDSLRWFWSLTVSGP